MALTEPPPGARSPSRTILGLSVMVIVLSTIAGMVAIAVFPMLVVDHPAVLLALDSRRRFVYISSATLPLATVFAIALPRSVITHYAYYYIGRCYGDAAIAWIGRRGGSSARAVARAELAFERFSIPLVLVSSGNVVPAVAGSVGMRAITFFVLTTLGSLIQTSAVIVLVWLTAEQAARVVGFIDSKSDYLTWIFSACVIAWILTVSVYRPLRTRHERRASGTTDGEGEAP